MDLIQFKDIWEMYRIKFIIDGKTSWENFWALKGVSFKVEKGETLGIIGENGAGKSTVLKLIMGMIKPDRGEVVVSGKVSGLLELCAGFQTELTGRENIYLNAGLFGLTQKQTQEKYKEIESFADIGKFINAPVKCYSQGMFVRLAFAIAIQVNPDILLIDDTLAVGDEYFQRKCVKRIFELKEQDKTIIFVTHDMNMLSRLCKRTIFLKDGRLIKDDLTDKVIPLYSQMIGTKEGVGILEKGPLNLVFNNGRFFLNWQDKLLAPSSGAYTSFLISDKWYSSIQADWEVKRERENKLLATGTFYQLALTQTWKLEITNDYEIKWDIEMDLQEPLEIQEGCTNIMLTNEYTSWFSTLEKGEFPPIDYKNKKWQALLNGNISMSCIGVDAKETPNGKIPNLIFQQSNSASGTYAQILNADYLTNCRILQHRTLGLQNYSATRANRLVYFSGKIILDPPDIKDYLNNLENESTLTNGKLRLTFDNGSCILNYNGIDLSKADHLSTSILVRERWYSSNLAYWDIKKEGKNKIVAYGNWFHLPLTQIWEVEIIGESSFSWKVSMQVNEELDIEQQHFYVTGCNDYTHWFSKYGEGKFPDTFLEVDSDILQRYIPEGLLGLKDQTTRLPSLSLRFSKELNNFAKIFNSDFCNKARILQIERVEPEQNIKFSPGQYKCFEIGVVLSKDKQAYRDDSVNILQNKKLKLVFDQGRGRIYCDGIELTKRLGLYTSLRSQGRWHDSATSAIWKIEERNKDTIKILGKWLYLPIIQFWEIVLKKDNLIEFKVRMKVEKEIEVDRLQTNLMVSEIYSQWVKDKEKHRFPVFKDDIDDDWDIIYSGQNGIKYIGVMESAEDKSRLPSIILCPEEFNADHRLNIVNSDVYHRGRVLQFVDANKKILPPADYLYFDGKIIIGERIRL